MRIAVTGSIATDHLMTFEGRFADSLVVEQLDKISLSFLAEDLQIRRGGVAANIAFGMGNLGLRPILVGAVGEDFRDYRSWLVRHGVDCDSILVSEVRHTARFVCTTDSDMAQIATFYAGAMSEARAIELGPVAERLGGLDLVVVSPNDPEAMLRHTAECRSRGIPFAADPSQQLAWMDGESIRQLIDGATYLFTNEYEAALAEQKTGWSPAEIAERVHTRIITKGRDGVTVAAKGQDPVHVPIAREARTADPTGVGDAFRAGFLAGLGWGLPAEQCAQVGSMLATYVIETVGTQEYELGQQRFLARFAEAYGAGAADVVRPHLHCLRP
ncbi:MAG TPA: carbohydrate kinase family protein [Segeticoccus sp.]|uniref:carbohydrate kinase family protein n=1 Tax=Segeticoccus sp. TaxID=2706531 RepID=UPI002D7F0AA8|nr:carbohydrate kinase family protein [Segeticoccus sp.]HET8600329.1 carbohydrate kinase family protein [Segeticoccus sp.]